METSANIKISRLLFEDLCIYAMENADHDDPRYQRIEKGIREKLDAIIRRKLYSEYKAGATEDARSRAREEYLDMMGVTASFRWTSGQDANVTRKPFVISPEDEPFEK